MIEMNNNPQISGLTTNPSLMKKAGVKDYKSFCLEVLKEVKTKPISFEVFTDDIADMKRQAHEITKWGKNVYVKIPITNSEGVSTIPLIKELSHSGINLNVTALLTLEQVIETTNALKGGAPSIVSVFAGRIADTGRNPRPIMAASLALCQQAGPDVELLWASTRESYNIIEADRIGCQIITVPPDIIKKTSMFGKNLKAVSLDTVKTFRADSIAAGFSL